MFRALTGSRYTTIVISIALFLVFDLGVLVVNFFISAEIRDDAVAVNLAGRQRMLSQRTVKTLLQVQNDLSNGRDPAKAVGELSNTVTLFDTTLSAFLDGGDVMGADGKPVTLAPAQTPGGVAAVAKGVDIWVPYKRLIDRAVSERVNPDALVWAIDYANSNNLALLKVMNDLTNDLEQIASSKADRLRLIQTVGITLALINFVVILFHFISRLRQADARAESYADVLEDSNAELKELADKLVLAKSETDDILGTVGEGLFLLDVDGRIGDAYSREMEDLFPDQNIAGQTFLELLAPVVDSKNWKLTRDFLKLLFQRRLKEKMLRNVNPLDEVDVRMESGAEKVLSFSFNRVVRDGEIAHVLVTVRDVTERVRLARELEESRGKAKDQIELMFGILHVEPARLREFLGQTTTRLDEINSLLRDAESGRGPQLRGVIDPIFRTIHSLKGDAAVLGLELFETACHEFEDEVSRLRDKRDLEGPDFVELTLKLTELRSYRDDTLQLVERVTGLRGAFAQEGEAAKPAVAADDKLLGALDRLVAELSSELDKPAVLDARQFDEQLIPAYAQSEVRDILVQLVRNSMAHGLESAEERRALDKQAHGQVQLRVVRQDGGVEIAVRDDGRGLMLEQIRQRALDQQLYSEEDLDSMNYRQIASLIFQPGFSTKDKADRTAGRGVGMDIVRDLVAGLGGRLRLTFAQNQFTEFQLLLPSERAA